VKGPLILDAGPLYSLADRDDRLGPQIATILEAETQLPIIPAPVTAEVDCLLGARLGARARRLFLADLAAGRFTVACLDADDHRTALELDERYSEIGLGLADLSLVVIAQRHDTRRLLTFDQRHFRTLRPLQGGTFTLLPFDA